MRNKASEPKPATKLKKKIPIYTFPWNNIVGNLSNTSSSCLFDNKKNKLKVALVILIKKILSNSTWKKKKKKNNNKNKFT